MQKNTDRLHQKTGPSSKNSSNLIDAGSQQQIRRRTRTILVMLIIFFFILSFDFLSRIAVLLLILTANAAFALIKKKIPKFGNAKYFFGIEIILFSTVLTSLSFGQNMGAVMGPLLMLINYAIERRASKYFMITTALYSMIGYCSVYLQDFNIITIGMVAALCYNLASFILTSLIGANKSTIAVFSAVNLVFNMLLFSVLGNFFLAVLK